MHQRTVRLFQVQAFRIIGFRHEQTNKNNEILITVHCFEEYAFECVICNGYVINVISTQKYVNPNVCQREVHNYI